MDQKEQSFLKHTFSFKGVFCTVLGVLVILSALGAVLMVTVPHSLGFEIYRIDLDDTGSRITPGSAAYVLVVERNTIEPGDTIAFYDVVGRTTRRVAENLPDEKRFIVEGPVDEEDAENETVPYTSLAGKVIFSIPYLGLYVPVYAKLSGKIYTIIFGICGVMLVILGDLIRGSRRSAAVERYLREREETE